MVVVGAQLAVRYSQAAVVAEPFLREKVSTPAHSTIDIPLQFLALKTSLNCQPASDTLSRPEVGLALAGKTDDAGAGLAVDKFLVALVAERVDIFEVVPVHALLAVSSVEAGYATWLSVAAGHAHSALRKVLFLAQQTKIGRPIAKHAVVDASIAGQALALAEVVLLAGTLQTPARSGAVQTLSNVAADHTAV